MVWDAVIGELLEATDAPTKIWGPTMLLSAISHAKSDDDLSSMVEETMKALNDILKPTVLRRSFDYANPATTTGMCFAASRWK
jgi:hypothetical protein